MNSVIYQALREMGLPENTVIEWGSEIEEQMTSLIVSFLDQHDMAELAELFSFAELLQMANPLLKQSLTDANVTILLRAVQGDVVEDHWSSHRTKLISVKDDERVMEIAKSITQRLTLINKRFKYYYHKRDITVALDSQPFVRLEVREVRQSAYLMGDIIVEYIDSMGHAKSKFPTFIWDGAYKLGLRPAKRQMCIRNVTEGVLLKFVRLYMVKNKIT